MSAGINSSVLPASWPNIFSSEVTAFMTALNSGEPGSNAPKVCVSTLTANITVTLPPAIFPSGVCGVIIPDAPGGAASEGRAGGPPGGGPPEAPIDGVIDCTDASLLKLDDCCQHVSGGSVGCVVIWP